MCNVSFSFGDTRILNDVSISIPDGDFHALLGSSGSGKTTLLRIIAGFLKPDSGTILINGKDVTLGMLVNDKDIYNKLDSTVGKLKSLLDDIEKYPRRYTGVTERQRKKGDKEKEGDK